MHEQPQLENQKQETGNLKLISLCFEVCRVRFLLLLK
jgi:hypothetical protein